MKTLMKIFFILIIATSSFLLLSENVHAESWYENIFANSKSKQTPAQTVSNATSCPKLSQGARLSFVGDILLHKFLYELAVKHHLKFKVLWSDLIPTLTDADFTVGNLEGPVAPGIAIGGKATQDPGFVHDGVVYSGTNFVFNFHPQSLVDLSESGFDLVTLANNHSLDRGSIGVDKTIEQINKTNLLSVGTKHSVLKSEYSKVVVIKNIRVGFTGCTEMTNGWKDSKSQVLKCQSQEMVGEIKKLKETSDFVVVLPHWGSEYKGQPNQFQKNLARIWVQNGVDLIVGSHPHVLQTTEWLTAPSGKKVLVVYSLGNFVAAQKNLDRSTSAVIHIDIQKSSTQTAIQQFSYTPFYRPVGSRIVRLTDPHGKFFESYQHAQAQLGATLCNNKKKK